MQTIKLIDVIDEDFVNYKKISMALIFPFCNFKCGKDNCQNYGIQNRDITEIDINIICERYLSNQITNAIVCHGLEPMDSFEELYSFITILRNKYHCEDDIVIYTGYNESEINDKISKLKSTKNIIIKFGRFIPDKKSCFDDILGVTLASHNQYAKRIS